MYYLSQISASITCFQNIKYDLKIYPHELYPCQPYAGFGKVMIMEEEKGGANSVHDDEGI